MILEETIYITSPKAIQESEWMNTFIVKLKMALSRTMNKSYNWIQSDSDISKLNKYIEDADFFIVVLDARENADEHYLNELYAISDKLQSDSTIDSSQNKLFKIYLSPGIDILQPAFFKTVDGYNFFENVGRKDNLSVLGFEDKEQSVKSWKLLLDLAYDFKELNKTIIQDSAKGNDNNKFLYLTLCSSDLMPVRRELKRELQHMGYMVLPKTDISDNTEEFEQTIIQNLDKCSFSVQLLGSKYGSVPQGDRYSIIEKEGIVISKHLENSEVNRIIWIPENNSRREQKQELYINRLKRLESNKYTEIIESSVDEFKDILTKRLANEKERENIKEDASNIYLIAPRKTEYGTITSMANDFNLKIDTIDFTNQETLYKQHLNLLVQNDNLLIDWSNKDQFWLNSKLSDIIKAPGFGKKAPFKNIALLTNGTSPKLSGLSKWLPKITIIQHDSMEELSGFLQKITE